MIAKTFNAAEWIPLIRTLVARRRIPYGTYDDAVQEVLLYLHRLSQDGKFLDVRQAVRWALADWLRGTGSPMIRMPRSLYERGASQKIIHSLHGMESRNGEDQIGVTLPFVLDQGFKRVDDQDEISVYLNWVTTDEAFVLRNGLLTGGELSDAQCGRKIGLCASRVSQLRTSGLRTIQGLLRALRRPQESS